MYASASLPSSMPARFVPSAALAAAASSAAAAGSKWPRPIVRSTPQPLLEASLATACRSAALSDPDAHAGGGSAGAVHATRVSAETPPKRSTPGPSERSRRTRLPLPSYCAIRRRLETSKERPRNWRGTRRPPWRVSMNAATGAGALLARWASAARCAGFTPSSLWTPSA